MTTIRETVEDNLLTGSNLYCQTFQDISTDRAIVKICLFLNQETCTKGGNAVSLEIMNQIKSSRIYNLLTDDLYQKIKDLEDENMTLKERLK